MILDGFTKCFFNRPTTPNNAGIQHAPFHSESIRPLGKSRTFPAKSYDEVVSFVVILLLCYGPFHVVGGISKAIVNTVNSMLQSWFWADMSVEGRKVVKPKRRNRYSSPSVISELFIMGISATIFHALPCAVFRAIARAGMNTAATFCLSGTQARPSTYRGFSTFAAVFPFSNTIGGVFRSADNSETPKSLAGKIDKILSWHGKHTISFMRKCQGIA